MAKNRAKTARTRRPPEQFGAGDFIEFVWDWGHPEWLVVAVEAPLEDAAAAYAKRAKARQVWPDVPLRPQGEKDKDREPLVPVVQPRDCDWTAILRLAGVPVGEPDWNDGRSLAKRLSKKLDARAVVFLGEDTSHAMGCFRYDRGEEEETIDWDDQGDSTVEAFSEWGVYVAPCFPRRLRGKLVGIAPEAVLNRIRRVDLVDIGPDL